MSNESIKSNPVSKNTINPLLTKYLDSNIRVKFKGNCLKQDNITYTHGKVVNIYIVYGIFLCISSDSLPTLENCLFGAVTLTKNADIDKYKYSGYGIGFDRKGRFSFLNGVDGKNVAKFGADMNSSQHIDNKGKDILILGIGPAQGLGEHSLTAEKMYSINFSMGGTKFCLSLHYNQANSFLLVNGTKIIKFKAKDSKIVVSPLFLGSISKDRSTDNMLTTGLNGNVYDFSVDYNSIAVDDIKDIHKYLMKKNNMIWYDKYEHVPKNNSSKSNILKCLYLLKKWFIWDSYFYYV